MPSGHAVNGGVGVVTVMDTPSAAQRPYAFVEGSDNHLWVRWWDGTSWHWADEGTPPGKTVKAGVGVVTVKDTPSAAQRPYAFVEGSDSHLWVRSGERPVWQRAAQGTPPGKTGTA